VASTQVVCEAVHTWRAQALAAVQNWPATQSTSALQATHWLRVVLQTWRIALHSRSEVHGSGRSTQALSWQRWVVGQSRSALQSTQIPRVVAHTWPGHIVELVQRVTGTQAWRRQASGAAQSLGTLHCTQSPVATSQTRPVAEHSRSEVQLVAVGGASGATTASTADGGRSLGAPRSLDGRLGPLDEQAASVKAMEIPQLRVAVIRSPRVMAATLTGTFAAAQDGTRPRLRFTPSADPCHRTASRRVPSPASCH
jgi:hypothetical protein